MITLETFKNVDLAIFAVSAALFLLGVVATLFAIPLHKARYKQTGTAEFNTLWPSRAFLAAVCAFWMAVQTLRLDSIWGVHSILLPDYTVSWVSEGWLCRIYLTAALGIGAPLAAFTLLTILASGARQRDLGDVGFSNPIAKQTETNAKIIVLALVCTVPVALMQTATAWVSVWVEYNGEAIEKTPYSLLGYFFGVYQYGSSPEQCDLDLSTTTGYNTTDTNNPGNGGLTNIKRYNEEYTQGALWDSTATGGAEAAAAVPTTSCTACIFPAATAIIHLVWTLVFVVALWVVRRKVGNKAANAALKRRLDAFCWLITVIAELGAAAMGASVGFDPFSWANQGLWIGYAATAALAAFLMIFAMVLKPTFTIRRLSKKLKDWDKVHRGGSFWMENEDQQQQEGYQAPADAGWSGLPVGTVSSLKTVYSSPLDIDLENQTEASNGNGVTANVMVTPGGLQGPSLSGVQSPAGALYQNTCTSSSSSQVVPGAFEPSQYEYHHYHPYHKKGLSVSTTTTTNTASGAGYINSNYGNYSYGGYGYGIGAVQHSRSASQSSNTSARIASARGGYSSPGYSSHVPHPLTPYMRPQPDSLESALQLYSRPASRDAPSHAHHRSGSGSVAPLSGFYPPQPLLPSSKYGPASPGSRYSPPGPV